MSLFASAGANRARNPCHCPIAPDSSRQREEARRGERNRIQQQRDVNFEYSWRGDRISAVFWGKLDRW